MNRRILNLAALMMVGMGAAHLAAKPATASDGEEFCCTSGNGEFTCCGTLYCSSGPDSCEARNKPGEE